MWSGIELKHFESTDLFFRWCKDTGNIFRPPSSVALWLCLGCCFRCSLLLTAEAQYELSDRWVYVFATICPHKSHS